MNYEVLIVGAGPVGLTLAHILKRFGISFKIIDKNKQWSNKSKAMTITSRTLELLNTIGISDKMVEEGIPSYFINYYYTHHKLATANFTSLQSKYNFLLQISQMKTTKILDETLKALGQTVDREEELIRFKRFNEKIICHIEEKNTNTIRQVEVRYLIACDGGQSTIRKLDGIHFMGEEQAETFLMADVAIKNLPLPFNERHLFYLAARSFFVIMPIENTSHDKIYRIITTEAGNKKYEASYVLGLFKKLLHNVGINNAFLYDPKWISTFNPKQFVVNSLDKDNVFYVGDAAHIQSPIGSQGLNTGIQDAFNLGWKLALSIKNNANDFLLDTYNEERLPVAHRLFNYNDKISKIIFGYKPLQRLWNILPKFLLHIEKYNQKEIQAISQHTVNYEKKSGNSIRRLPNFITATGESIYDLISPTHFNLVLFSHKENFKIDSQHKLLKLVFIRPHFLAETASSILGYVVRPDGYVSKTIKNEYELTQIISSSNLIRLVCDADH